MYERILLASDGSRESLVALREGALIAQALKAEAFLLIVHIDPAGMKLADAVYPAPRDLSVPQGLLNVGLERLARLGVKAGGEVVTGEPAPAIAACARRFRADLIVVGHRRQTLLERWWSGASGAYLVDSVDCSVLLARDVISDQEFEAHLASKAKA
jgi:nucleotide-binding universal stress UspA family protein